MFARLASAMSWPAWCHVDGVGTASGALLVASVPGSPAGAAGACLHQLTRDPAARPRRRPLAIDSVASMCDWTPIPGGATHAVVMDPHGRLTWFCDVDAEQAAPVEQMPGAGQREGGHGGLMSQVRAIGGRLWACGHLGQVYRRDDGGDWRHADDGLFARIDPAQFSSTEALLDALDAAPALDALDGRSDHDVYVIGRDGFLAHFDGGAWQCGTLDGREDLSAVLCSASGEVWIAGAQGSLWVGRQGLAFERCHVLGAPPRWTGLCEFNGQLFLSAAEGLYVHDGRRVTPLTTGLSPALSDAGRLHAAGGLLWSIGPTALACFDGRHWERLAWPDPA